MNKRRPRWTGLALLGVAWLSVVAVPRTDAHPACLTGARVVIGADGHFRLAMEFDTLAFALNDTSMRIGNEPMEALLAGPRADLDARLLESQGRFVHGFVVTTDRGAVTVRDVDFPRADAVLDWRDKTRPVLPVILPVRVTGELPPGTATVAFRFPAVLDRVILVVERPGEEPCVEPVEPGTASTTLTVRLGPATAKETRPVVNPGPH